MLSQERLEKGRDYLNYMLWKKESLQLVSTLTTKLNLEEDAIVNKSRSLEDAINNINELNIMFQDENEGIEDFVLEEEIDNDEEDQNE